MIPVDRKIKLNAFGWGYNGAKYYGSESEYSDYYGIGGTDKSEKRSWINNHQYTIHSIQINEEEE